MLRRTFLELLAGIPFLGYVAKPAVAQSVSAPTTGKQKSFQKAITALALFRPTTDQEAFFRSVAGCGFREMAVSGKNRSGKTVAMAVWFASLALDEPITMRDGTQLHMRPEHLRGFPLDLMAVGYDWKHCGETIYRTLFTAGLFRIVKDEKSGQWRSYNHVADKARKSETKPSPPLLPLRTLEPDGIRWENKRDRQLSFARLKNGSTITFAPSTMEFPPTHKHAIWIDEKLVDGQYNALLRMSEGGVVAWSSWIGDLSMEFCLLLDQVEEKTPYAKRFFFRAAVDPIVLSYL